MRGLIWVHTVTLFVAESNKKAKQMMGQMILVADGTNDVLQLVARESKHQTLLIRTIPFARDSIKAPLFLI